MHIDNASIRVDVDIGAYSCDHGGSVEAHSSILLCSKYLFTGGNVRSGGYVAITLCHLAFLDI